MTTAFVDLDIRPALRSGGEPFPEIMQAVAALAPGQGLRLLTTFEPVPLFSVLGSKGFDHEATALDGGDWETLFRPTASAAVVADASDWPAPVQELDSRDLDPPEPMVRILAALERLNDGEVLSALLCREPIFLIPELVKRGHAWRGGFEPDGKTYRIVARVGAARQAAA
jgi:TusA-related sulfurtransferase